MYYLHILFYGHIRNTSLWHLWIFISSANFFLSLSRIYFFFGWRDTLFLDATGGGYYSTPEGDSSILFRVKDDYDGAEPSPNSVSAINLIRFSLLVQGDKAQKLLKTAEHLLVYYCICILLDVLYSQICVSVFTQMCECVFTRKYASVCFYTTRGY